LAIGLKRGFYWRGSPGAGGEEIIDIMFGVFEMVFLIRLSLMELRVSLGIV